MEVRFNMFPNFVDIATSRLKDMTLMRDNIMIERRPMSYPIPGGCVRDYYYAENKLFSLLPVIFLRNFVLLLILMKNMRFIYLCSASNTNWMKWIWNRLQCAKLIRDACILRVAAIKKRIRALLYSVTKKYDSINWNLSKKGSWSVRYH